jgi:hypothetical protein
MQYGEFKVDQITFTNNGVDQTITVSGIVSSISGDITATGTISGDIIKGNTVSGNTVTGEAGQFTTLTGGAAGFTTVTGATVTGTTANFVTVSGATVTGNTANFVTVSGTTVTGITAQFVTVTGGTAGFTTITGTTVTGTTANFITVSGTNVTGITANFVTVSGATVTGTTANFVSGLFTGNSTAAAFIPTGSTIPANGLYLPSTNTAGIATAGSGRVFVDASGNATINNQGALRFADSDSSNWVAFRASSTVTGNVTWTLPPIDATVSGHALKSDASGILSWGTAGGATGGGGDDVFYENSQTVTTDYTLTTNKNAMSAGPITIGSGVTVTIPTDQYWSIV